MPFWKQRNRFEEMLEEILANQRAIYPKLEKFMSTTPITLAQLTTDVTTLQTALTTGLTDLAAEIANLKASNPGVDFSSLDSVVNSMTSQVQAADPGAQSTGSTGTAANAGSARKTIS